MKRHVLALTLFLTVAITPVLVIASGAQALPRPDVTIGASSSKARPGAHIRVKGQVSGKSRHARVILQRKVRGAWQRKDQTRVRRDKRYSFRLRVQRGKHRYRTKVLRTKRHRSATSRVVVVRGKRTASKSRALADLSKVRKTILHRTNDFRAENGRPPLKRLRQLNAVAQRWAKHMADKSDFSHNPDFFRQYPNQRKLRSGGENIAYGQGHQHVVNAWIASVGHRLNLLGDYTHLGIGYAKDKHGRPYYTQNLARYVS